MPAVLLYVVYEIEIICERDMPVIKPGTTTRANDSYRPTVSYFCYHPGRDCGGYHYP
jgi:hypothetical protein